MCCAVLPAALEHVEEAHQIGVDIGVRVFQRVAHAGLRGEVHDQLGPQRREQGRVAARSARSSRAKLKPWRPCMVEARLLQPRVVILVQAVDADHAAAVAQQPVGQMIADEARAPVSRMVPSWARLIGSQAPVGEGRGPASA